MRVVCQTPQEFIECLESEEFLFQEAVRYSIVFEPVNEAKIQVTVKLSAVVDIPSDGAQYLLLLGYVCGVDYTDGDRKKTGTTIAKATKELIRNFCEQKHWRLLPGAIEE